MSKKECYKNNRKFSENTNAEPLTVTHWLYNILSERLP